MIPLAREQEDVWLSVSKCASPQNEEMDVQMEEQSIGNNFDEAVQLFRKVD